MTEQNRSGQYNRREVLAAGMRAGVGVLGLSALTSLMAGCVSTTTTGGSTTGTSTTPAPAPKPVKDYDFQLSWIKDAQMAGLFAAVDQGFLKEAGLNLNIRAGGPNIDSRAIVGSGSVPWGTSASSPAFLQAVQGGAQMVTVAATLQSTPAGLMSPKNKPIRTMQDAVGKRIGLQTGARAQWALAMTKAGLKPESVTIVTVGVDPTPLVAGEVDGYWGFRTNQAIALADRGFEIHFMSLDDMGVQQYGDIVLVNNKFVKEQPEAIVSFLKAFKRGWEYAEKNSDAVVKSMVEKHAPNLDATLQNKVAKATYGVLRNADTEKNGLFTMRPEVWENQVKLMYDNKQLEKILKVEEFLNLEILKSVK